MKLEQAIQSCCGLIATLWGPVFGTEFHFNLPVQWFW